MLLICCLVFTFCGSALAADTAGDIVVLYTNDVHCAVDDNIGYAGRAAYKADMEAQFGADRVTLVDDGDALQGAAIGTLSKGEYLVDIMNEVGYDIFVPGNHEFDYGMARMLELMGMMNAAVLSCNFISLDTGETVFEPYQIIDYGDMQIAYVGISTPKTFTSSTPKYFQDDSGNYIYSFCEDATGAELYSTVQASVDAAIAAGADVVVALGHCGVGEEYAPWQSTDIIANTTGIDVFIDGHSHSSIAGDTYQNENGDDVILSSTGTKLAAIGKLVVTPEGAVSTELITDYTEKDATVDAYVKSIQAENEELLSTVVARTDVALVITDPATGNRMVRNRETNLGDLCADAYRELLGADVAVVNGGGVRANIAAGEITYNDIIAVHPFGNSACVVEASGQEILDLLEMGARNTPAESGGFMQVSGMSYEIHTYIQSSVVLDDKSNFVRVDGEYRVKNVLVGGEPLDLSKTYTLASHNYLIKNGGDGFTEFMDNTLLQDEVMIDNQVLITYIVDELGGVVGSAYSDPYGQGRIDVMETPFTDVTDDAWYSDSVVYVYGAGLMNGTAAAAFSPDTAMSRAMFVTTLYRLAGSPAVEGSVSGLFADCAEGSWYADAVVWAVQNGITTGVSENAFAPNVLLTRQEMAAFLYRYIQSTGGGFADGWSYDPSFTDTDSIASWAYEAAAFCSQNGIITGTPSGAFAPTGTATRAMGAAVLQRYEATLVQAPAA
jgi:2',3'-cyclic-nucleotide 2'-phosphodiesterase (5'-nucleotidase family)